MDYIYLQLSLNNGEASETSYHKVSLPDAISLDHMETSGIPIDCYNFFHIGFFGGSVHFYF